jgi:transposase
MPLRDIAENLGVSIPTLYRWVTASEKKQIKKSPDLLKGPGMPFSIHQTN